MLQELLSRLSRRFIKPLPLDFYQFGSAGFRNPGSRGNGRKRAGFQVSLAPAIVSLEDRILLSASIVVNNPTDTPVAGLTDLREAIAQANTNGGNQAIIFDAIVFATAQTITLGGAQLELRDTTGTATITITGPTAGVTVSGNNVSRVFQVDVGVTASISGLTITSGKASIGDGGGIANWGNLTLRQCWVTSNTAVGNGGGLANFGSVVVTGSTFSYNAADNGGAIANLVNHQVQKFAPNLAVRDSTIVANIAVSSLHNTYYDGQGGGDDGPELNVGPRYGSGGGIFNDGWIGGNQGTVTIDFSTIVANQANDGGGIYNVPFQGGQITLSATAVGGNVASGRGTDISGEIQATYSLIQITDSNATPGIDGYGSIEGEYNLESLPPLLKPLGFYGGTTPTCPPVSDSPLINNGPLVVNTSTDQSGNPRVSGARADIGAVEIVTNALGFLNGTAAHYVDSSRVNVTVTLAGPGTGVIFVPEGGGNATSLVLSGTTNQSVLKIVTSGPSTTIGSISIYGAVAAIDASPVNLVGNMQIHGAVNSVAMNNVTTTLSLLLTIDGAAGALSFHDVQGLNVQVGGAIGSLSAATWMGFDIGRMSIQAADIGTIAIADGFKNTMIDSAGSIGSVTVGGLLSSVNIYAGVNPGSAPIPDPAVDFIANATIGSVSAATSQSPVVAARHLGTIDLGLLSDATQSASSGLVAGDIASLRFVNTNGTTIVRTGLNTADHSEQFSDQFQVTLDVTPPKTVWKFAVTGDDRGMLLTHQVNTTVLKKVASGILRDNVDFVLFVGDLVHRGQNTDGAPAAFELWKHTISGVAADTNHMPAYHIVLGNHEIANRANPATNYVNAFPTQVFPLGSGDSTTLLFESTEQQRPNAELSYDFIHKSVLFIGLDNYGPSSDHTGQYGPIDGHATSRQADALASLKTLLDGQYTSSVMHGHVPATELLGNSGATAVSLFQNFVNLDGKYYFAGHAHIYVPTTPVDKVPGLTQTIVGTAGAPLDNAYTGGYGYLLVTASNGKVIDGSLIFQKVNIPDVVTVSNVETTTGSYMAGGTAVPVTSTVTVTDSSSMWLTGATVSLGPTYQAGQDLLAFTNTSQITGSFDLSTGTLTLTGTDAVASYQTALRSITYQNTSVNPTPNIRRFTIGASDGASTSASAYRYLNTTSLISNVETSTDSYVPGSGAVPVTTTLTLGNTTTGNVTDATVQIDANYVIGQDLLAFTNTLKITGAFNATTGTLTLTGTDSVANFQAALRSVTYTNTTSTPATEIRRLALTVNGAINNNFVVHRYFNMT